MATDENGREILTVLIRDTVANQDVDAVDVRGFLWRHVRNIEVRMTARLHRRLQNGILSPPANRYQVQRRVR